MSLAAVADSSSTPSRLSIWAGAALALSFVYWLIFITTGDMPAAGAWVTAVSNVAPLILLASITRSLLLKRVFRQPAALQIIWQALLAIAFAAAWYAGSRLCVGLTAPLIGYPLRITGFTGPALAWQSFQGLVLYTALAAISYAQRSPTAARNVEAHDNSRSLQRYLVRSGEDFRSVDVNQIITITGAQDYSEVTTVESRHLVRLTLGEFERKLDPQRFIRVHRSAIIHVAHLERAELAGGGRMLAHMSNGQSVAVSRAGVKALRTLIV